MTTTVIFLSVTCLYGKNGIVLNYCDTCDFIVKSLNKYETRSIDSLEIDFYIENISKDTCNISLPIFFGSENLTFIDFYINITTRLDGTLGDCVSESISEDILVTYVDYFSLGEIKLAPNEKYYFSINVNDPEIVCKPGDYFIYYYYRRKVTDNKYNVFTGKKLYLKVI